MALIVNPATGEIITTEDPTWFYQNGYRDASAEELDHSARVEEFGSFEQQAQAQAERVVRGATFGAIDGFGSPEDNRARAEVSEELSPVLSGVASVVPDVAVAALSGGLGGLATGAGRAAGRAALAEGAGLVRAGLATARAGGAVALGAESAATGLQGAAMSAYAEGRELGDDLGKDAENALFWGGLNFGLGALALRGATRSGAITEGAGSTLDDIAKSAEFRAETVVDEAIAPTSPVDLTGKSLGDLGALETGMRPESLERLRANEAFRSSGRLETANPLDAEDGISIGVDPETGQPLLQDGRHRLQVARESGLTEMHGTVRDIESGETLYRGKIPMGAVRQGEREAVENGVERALRNASLSDADDIVDSALGSIPTAEADSFGRQRRLYINREAIFDVASREMQEDISKLVQDVGKVARQDKASAVSSNVSNNLAAQRSVAKGIAQDAAKFAGEIRAEARAYAAGSGKQGLQYAIPGQKSWNLALMDHAKELEQATTGRGLFEALDGFKRAAQEYKLSLEAGALNSPNPIHHQKLIPRIDSFASRLRGALEDSGVWGKAGEMQRAYNAVISDKLMPHMRVFEEAVLQRTHRGYDGLWNTEGWESKISSLLRNSDPGNRRHVGAVLDAMDELAGVRRQFGDPKTAGRIEGQTAKVRRTLGLADEVADATERMKALGDLVSGVPMGGALAGGLAGGLPGAVVGAALPGAVRGFVMGDIVAAFQRLSGASEAAAQRGVDDWIRSSRVRSGGLLAGVKKALPQLSPEARQLRDVATRQGITQGMALFRGEDSNPTTAFTRLREKLLDVEGFFTDLGNDYGTLREADPEAFMVLTARADLARRFLIERMPPQSGVSAANPEGNPPSRDAIEDWATYVNAVRFPGRVVRNLGGIRVQEIETLRTVYPRQYEDLQLRLLTTVARARETGEKLSDNFLLRANLLFPELDGLGSPVFSREYGEAVRKQMAKENMVKQETRGAGGGPMGALPRNQPGPITNTISSGATFGMNG